MSLAGLVAASGQAAIVIGNLGSDDGTDEWDISLLAGGASGMGFTVSSDFAVASVDLKLVIYAGTEPAISVAIFNNDTKGNGDPSDDLPGSALFSLSNPAFSADSAVHTYTFNDPAQHELSAGTTYWVVAFDNSDAGTDWKMRATVPTGDSASHFGVATDETESPMPTTRIASPDFLYQVNSVPEPAEWGLMAGSALLAFGLLRSHKKQARAN
ncbi:MAG: hypothetical protein HYY24_26620 [Verrucomicrobia bacterium]|nr:hypothetical protein [Verrucomicrobiota bacterium]